LSIHYIKKLISEGEHQQLDFKFEISDFAKIARTLAAFANTDGGRLLIGVKDNGAIAGVRSEEEFYMIEGAASLYCRPEVHFTSQEWDVDGKKVLEIVVERGSHAEPYQAPDKEGRYKVFIRRGDQNLLANRILLRKWKRETAGVDTLIRFRRNERLLLTHLEENGFITINGFRKISGLNAYRAETILLNFIMVGIIEMIIGEKETRFVLLEDYENRVKELDK
jgi:predicted HTH transcriptional regulator